MIAVKVAASFFTPMQCFLYKPNYKIALSELKIMVGMIWRKLQRYQWVKDSQSDDQTCDTERVIAGDYLVLGWMYTL